MQGPSTFLTIVANKVIVEGAGEGVFAYAAAPALGNLLATAGIQAAGVDNVGNNYLAGTSSYGSGFATSLQSGRILFYTGSLSAGWTFQAEMEISGSGELFITAASALFSDNLEIGSDLTVDGTLSVGGSTSTGGASTTTTSTDGLPNGGIQGTSGSASAGTAHTHGPGSYSVVNGQHSHTLVHTHPF